MRGDLDAEARRAQDDHDRYISPTLHLTENSALQKETAKTAPRGEGRGGR